MRRPYRIIHEPILVEWLRMNYPPGTWRTNVRVGPVAEEIKRITEEVGLPGVARLTAGSIDAVVELPDKTVLVEAMVRVDTGKISKLKTYRQLYLTDPQFEHRRGLPVELVLLAVIDVPLMAYQCEAEGVRYVHYCPDWAKPMLEALPKRIAQGHLGGVSVG